MHGVRKHERYGQRGKGGLKGEKQQNDILHKLLKQMGHRYKENDKEEQGQK